jgi:hypothetical protein
MTVILGYAFISGIILSKNEPELLGEINIFKIGAKYRVSPECLVPGRKKKCLKTDEDISTGHRSQLEGLLLAKSGEI